MAGKIYRILPQHLLRQINQLIPNGGRFSFTPEKSNRNPIFLEDRDKEIVRLHEQGKNPGEIAEIFGLTKIWVRKILKKNGRPLQPEEKKLERNERIKLMLSMDYKKTRIAKELGISRERIYQIMRQEGL